MIKWTGKVGPANRNSDYANRFTVLAETREEAIDKFIKVGGYRRRDTSIWITGAEEQPDQALSRVLLAQAWRDGYYTGKRDYAGSVTGGQPIRTPNPYEEEGVQ